VWSWQPIRTVRCRCYAVMLSCGSDSAVKELAKRCHSPVISSLRWGILGIDESAQFHLDLFLLQDEQHNLNLPSKGLLSQ
jgi:hypothetical protein